MSQITSLVSGGGGGSGIQILTGNTGSATGSTVSVVGGTGIVTSGSGSNLTISSSGTTTLNYTSVTTTPYVVLSTDSFLGVSTTSLAITVELPNAPSTGRVYIVKDATGFAAARNITVTTVGGTVLIDASATFIMNTGFQATQFLFNGTKYLAF